jgi:dTDP-glucose 4,6-dehydratase
VHGDICESELVQRLLHQHAIDTIVHFAAESHVDRSIAGPDVFLTTNVIGTQRLLEAARAHLRANPGPFRFHHVSTDEVYGSLGLDDPPFTETTPYAPNSPYAASKAASDHVVRAWHHTYGVPVTTSNCSNNYGPYQFPEKLIPWMLTHALRGMPLGLYGDGRNRRDWLFVDDHCHGIDLVLARGALGETYNIGGGRELENIELVRLLCGELDARFAHDAALRERYPDCPAARGARCAEAITFVTDRAGHDRRYAIDHTKASGALGYAPTHAFERGVAATVDWYLTHEEWWRPLLP